MGFIVIPHILAIISCSVFGIGCAAPHVSTAHIAPAPTVSIVHSATSSTHDFTSHNFTSVARSASGSSATVTTTINGSTTRAHMDAPYGISSKVVSQTVNGKTITYATTTPLTQADINAMEAHLREQEVAMKARIAQMQADQKQMLERMHEMMGTFDFSGAFSADSSDGL